MALSFFDRSLAEPFLYNLGSFSILITDRKGFSTFLGEREWNFGGNSVNLRYDTQESVHIELQEYCRGFAGVFGKGELPVGQQRDGQDEYS